MSVLKLTASQANSLSPLFPGQGIFVKDTGFGFSQDAIYFRNSAGTAWIPLTGGKHKHDADTDVAGGFYSDVLTSNAQRYFDMQGSSLGDYMNTGTATATEEPSNGRIALTAAATGTFRHLVRGGVGLDFGRPSVFVFKGNSTANTQFSAKIGVCMENVNDAHTDLRKYGIEACDSTGTAQTNWLIVSATGAGGSRTTTSAPENPSQASARGYRLVHNVGQSVQFFVNGSLNQTKSTNIPASGSNAINNISVGYKTNNTTSKTLYVHYSRLVGSVSDSAFA
jgi:hypothetical protein